MTLATSTTELTLTEAMDNVYASIRADNLDLNTHIAALKAVMTRDGLTEAVFEPGKLAQNNRQGRKLMQSYFRKRGIDVVFAG